MEKLQLTTRTFLLLGAGACLIAACSPAASSSRGGTTGSGAGGSGASDAPMGSECKTPNLTRACSSCGAGFQLCTSELKWSACTCSALTSSGGSGGSANGGGAPGTIPAGNLDQSITFDWPESQSSGGTCEAGRYEGNFDGAYCFSAGFGGGGGGNYGPNFTG
ncbi:MAG TPA: hypothetical protein VHM19_06335, partial [Polyangiales bacterium]|nr:hypothetical protein [Polyangiales bacterium]